jgi:hypothetical protein
MDHSVVRRFQTVSETTQSSTLMVPRLFPMEYGSKDVELKVLQL